MPAKYVWLHPARHWNVCVPCRYLSRSGMVCPHCRTDLKAMWPAWRPPKRGDDAAWAKLARGQWLWDERSLRGRQHGGPWPWRGRSRSVRSDRRLTRTERGLHR